MAEGPSRVVLVGFMGAGKTTIGAEVARQLQWTFLDMDQRIEERTGVSVAETFRRQGEAAFREQELRLAEEISTLREHVVAAGGGAFAQPATREALRVGALTVWLRCALETLLSRVGPDGSRPLAGSRETMRQLLAEREPSYRLADVTVDASASPDEVARRILEAVRSVGPGPARRTSSR